jgi:hypothetical protein
LYTIDRNTAFSKKAAVALRWQRVEAVIAFLTKNEGIAEQRIGFAFDFGHENVVGLVGSSEEIIKDMPAPWTRSQK